MRAVFYVAIIKNRKRNRMVALYPDKKLRKQLETLAAKEHRSLGAMVREIIRRQLAKEA